MQTLPIRQPIDATVDSHWRYAFAVVALWIVTMAWARPLHLPDEGRYVGIAWEMLHSHDWLVPHLNTLPYFDKPPLYYWLGAAAMAVFGVTEFAVRMPSALGALAATFAVHALARRWAGEGVARWSLVVLALQPLLFLGAEFANMDTLVAGCITASIASFAHAALNAWDRPDGPRHAPALAIGYAAAALGVLAKGLIGAVLPALVIMAWLMAHRRWRVLRSLVWLPGLCLFMLIALPWFIAMQWRFPGYAHYFFVVQHVQRFATSGFNNMQPIWFYPAVLVGFAAPWIAWMWPALRDAWVGIPAAAFDRRRPHVRSTEDSPLYVLMWSWFVVVVVFFSIPQSKLIGYIVPAVPPLAFLIAAAIARRADLPGTAAVRMRRLAGASGTAAVLACAAVVAAFAHADPKSARIIGRTLAERRAADEPVYMLEQYQFDLSFYARMHTPAFVVEDWSSPEVPLHDDTRRELYEAGRFDAQRAAQLLVEPASLASALCRAPVSWVVAPLDAVQRHAFLALVQPVASVNRTGLWRVDSARPGLHYALDCAAVK
jgi:4-amino-4-deoxy-L-arabinose transferase-like glycosyltransferase